MPAFKGRHVQLLQASTLKEVGGGGVQLGRESLVRFQYLDFHFVPGMWDCALIWRLAFDNQKIQEPAIPAASSPGGEFAFIDLWPKAQRPPASGLLQRKLILAAHSKAISE